MSVDPSRTHALIVAVDRYRSGSVNDLPGLTETAAEFARWLTDLGVPEENIIQLGSHTTEATTLAVDEVLTDELPGRSGDLLWIFWVGHGVLDSEGRRRLLLADATDRSMRSLDLNKLLQLYGSNFLSGFMRQLVVVDACQTDLPVETSVRWPEPLSLPGPGDRMIGRSQRVWLAAGAGERAAYSEAHGRAWFSDFVVENARAGGALHWEPDYEVVREGLRARLEAHAPKAVWRQHPVQLQYTSETGETRSEDIASTGSTESLFHPERLGRDPALAAYLRWLVATHGDAEADIGGLRVRAPLAEAPWTGSLANLPATYHDRRRAADYLRREAERAGDSDPEDQIFGAMSARPLPSYATSANHIDRLDLDGLEQTSAKTLLWKAWRSIVLGDPGSGKTTLARRLVLREAARGPAPEDPLWRLPVLCRAADLIRALAESDEPPTGRNALAVLAAVAGWNSAGPRDPLSGDLIAPAALSRLVVQAADHHRLLLVIDGLDEVPTLEGRAALVAQIGKALDLDRPRYDFPSRTVGNQLLVTSRIAGYYLTPLTESVQQYILKPMDADSVLASGMYWLRAFARATGQGEARAAAMEEQFRSLTAQSDTAELASNPYLMVSLVSAVESGVALRSPDGRGIVRSDLYGFMVNDALDRGARRFPHVPQGLLLDLHTALADRIHQTCKSGVLDKSELRACVRVALGALPHPDVCEVDDAITYVQGLGLLTERAQGLFGFLHLTLEEYLAGRWLVAGPDAAGRVRRRLGDPRWVEPVRLGLGHLSRAEPAGFAALLGSLLTGTGADHVAALLASGLGEWSGVRTDHLEAAVLAQLSADVRLAAADDDLRSAPADALAPLLSSPVVLPEGERPVEVIARVLARALDEGSGAAAAAAARLADALRLDDPQVAEALYHAQFRDSTAFGWVTVRALRNMAGGDGRQQPDPEATASARVWAELSEDTRNQLSHITVTVPPSATRAPTGRLLLPPALTPFRNALNDHLIERLETGPVAVLRVILCLYGIIDFQDTRRWLTERARLEAELSVLDTPPATRYSAAVRLDTVIGPALNQPAGDGLLVPERVNVDSPLTPRLLGWIRAETPPETLAEQLRAIAEDDGEDDWARGDALAAWFALGEERTHQDLWEVADRVGEEVRRRLVWRMDRACLVLGDAAARLSVGAVSTALDDPSAGVGYRVEAGPLVRRALQVLGVEAVSDDDNGHDGLSVSAAFVLAVYCWQESKPYDLAAILDTAGDAISSGGAEGVAAMLATAHRTVASLDRHPGAWDLDPLAPLGEPTVTEALTSLGLLAPRLTFMRCWLLDRMAPLLAERGFAVEAICLALQVHAHDPAAVEHTVRRIISLTRGLAARADLDRIAPDDPDLLDALGTLADTLPDTLQRHRSHLLVSILKGRSPDAASLAEAADGLRRPHDGLRLLELAVSRGATDWNPGLFQSALDLAAEVGDAADRVLAFARLARSPDPYQASEARAGMHAALGDAPAEHAWFLNEEVLSRYIGIGTSDHAAGGYARHGESELHLAAAHAISVLSGTAPFGGGYEDDAYIQADFIARVCGRSPDQAFTLAVFLDTRGAAITRRGPLGVAELLAAAPPIVAAFGPYSEAWDLDPLSPLNADAVAEALTALDGITEHLAFVRYWLLERMAALLAARGFAVEAVCLALRTIAHDSAGCVRTVDRFAVPLGLTLDAIGAADDSTLAEQFAQIAEDIPDPYPRNRAQLHVARLRGAAVEPRELLALAREVEDRHNRLRLLELALALDVSPWTPSVAAEAAACVDHIGDRYDRALARARLARHGGGAALEQVEVEIADAAEQWSDDEEPGLAEPLLRLEPPGLRNESRRPALFAWAITTCGAICADTLTALRIAEPAAASDGDELWRALADPARRRDTARALHRRGPGRRLQLTPEARRTVDVLLADDCADIVAEIFSVTRVSRHVPALATWRTAGDRRVADLATLLAIEAGRLDPEAVQALPRLLSDRDDLVRLRAGLATSAVGRGSGGIPRFRSAVIGSRTLAEFVRVTLASTDADPRTSADVWWALGDIVHTSAGTLTGTLRLLADDLAAAAMLLRSIRQVTAASLPALVDLLPKLPERLKPFLLNSLWVICRNPTRYGVTTADVTRLAPLLATFAKQASYRVGAHTTCVLGLIQHPTPELMRRHLAGALAGDDAVNPEEISAAPAQAYALGHLLARYRIASDKDAASAEVEAEVEEIISGLVSLTGSADAELSAAAVTALVRSGQLRRIPNLTHSDSVNATTILWGLLGSLDTDVIGIEYWRAVHAIVTYIRHPLGLTGADAAHHTDVLTGALLDRAVDQMRLPVSVGGGQPPTREAWAVCHLLSVLTGLAEAHRDGLRATVDEEHGDLCSLLIRELATSRDWLSRESAARLLVFLGDGDADTVRAILGTSQDTELIRQRVLRDAHWFDRVQADGLAVLLEAVSDAALSRAYLAARMLAVLVERHILDDDDHMVALEALQQAVQRPDADQPLFAEHSGHILITGSFGDACQQLLARLLTGDHRSAKPAGRIILDVPDVDGQPVRFYAPRRTGGENLVFLQYQVQYYTDVEDRSVADELLQALRAAATAAHAAAVPLDEVLAYAALPDAGVAPAASSESPDS